MSPKRVDLCIIGAGSGGLSAAAGAAQMGASVVLIERDKMGGDCLNYGCVPSKSLLAAAHLAKNQRSSDQFGIRVHEPDVDYAAVCQHIKNVIGTIAPHDSVERFEKLGCTVIKGEAAFHDHHTIKVNEQLIKARRIIIAAGSRPNTPSIEGLDKIPYFTNETIFDLTEKPAHLIVIGGGPIGCELAQAHRLLGTKVTILELFSILPKDDSELVDQLRKQLINDGIELHEKIKIKKIESQNKNFVVHIEKEGKQQTITGSHILVAAGRKPNIESLQLEKGGIAYTSKGITVDDRLRTSNKKVFAIGDIAGGYQFTHIANYHAGIVIRNALFRLPAKVNYDAVPWVTYTIPELAHVGIQEVKALEKFPDARVLKFDFSDNDRAQTEHKTNGTIKVITTKKGKILSVSILGEQAGELIFPWCLAIQEKLKIGALASAIAPYPTLSEINKRVAGNYFTSFLFSKKVKRVIRWLAKLG